MLTSAVSFFQSDIFEQLEHLYIPLFVRLVCILTRCVLYCVPTLCPCNLPLPSLLLCVLAAPRLPLLVSLASYTNLYVPFTRLSSEVLGPLEQEIQGLQAFRQPTQVTTAVPGMTCPCQEELQKAGTTCPVCLETMHVARITPCGHVFHSHCLRQCLVRSTACPYCRAPLV